jgi:hypothetical protein
MSFSTLHFDFYGVRAAITAEDPGSARILEHLSEDFGYFRADPASPHVQLQLFATAGSRRGYWRLFKTRMCRAYRIRGGRLCDYGGGSQVFASDPHAGLRRFEVHSLFHEERYEMAFVALLSSVGEELDRRGLHRIHALAVEPGVIAVLPQGGGKSAMAALLMRSESRRIHSDEIPLISRGIVYPFPLRLALRPHVADGLGVGDGRRFKRKIFDDKILFPLPANRTADTEPVRAILIGRHGLCQFPQVRRASRLRVFAGLVHSLVFGLGVPQMREYMLRPAPALIAIFISRLRQAAGLALHTPGFIFEVCADARMNAAALSDFCQREISNEDRSRTAQPGPLSNEPHYTS